jgi:hypothetical protein
MGRESVRARVRSGLSANGRVTTALKAGFAAVCAWLVGRYVVGHGNPYFAPIAALVSVHATVVQSLREGVRYVTCFGLGVLVAAASAEILGLGPVSLAITLVTGTLLGSWARFGGQGLEVPFTATFVLLLGGSDPEGFVAGRLLDVLVGVPIGIGVNALLLAPLHVQPAADGLRRIAGDTADLFDDMADGLTERWPPKNPDWSKRGQALDSALREALRAMSHADESLRLNPRGGLQQDTPRLLELLWDCFADVRGGVQSIAHSLNEAAADEVARPDEPSWLDEGFRVDYAELLRKISLVIRHRLSPTPRADPGTAEALAALADLREEIYGRPERSHAPWYTQSHLVIELNRILQSVCGTIDACARHRTRSLSVTRPRG